MKNKPLILLALLALSCFQSPAAVPLKWTVETSRLQPAVFDVVRGETLALEAAFKSYGKDVQTSNLTAFLCWQTNGMASAWWMTNAVTTASVARVLFTPEMDPGAPAVTAFLGLSDTTNRSSSLSYRAAFTLRFRHGPGDSPNVIEQPVPILDLAHTVVVNPPWPTQADFAATTTVMRAELKDYVDEQIEGAGLVTPETVTNIVDAKIAAIPKEGVSTNAVSAIITNHVNSGYILTVAAAQVMTNAIGGVKRDKTDLNVYTNAFTEWTFSGSGYNPTHSYRCYYEYDYWAMDDLTSGEGGWYSEIIEGEGENATKIIGWTGGVTATRIKFLADSGDRLATTNGVNAAIETATNGLASAETVTSHTSQLAQQSQQIAAIGAHLNAEDAHFVSTNYDSSVNLPEAYVEIKMSNTWITIWKEMTRWNKFAGSAFDWSGWGGFHDWKTNVTQQLSWKADRCWGAYDSETGGYSPDGYTQISSSNILIAANMAYQRKVTSGGAVWVLQCNSGVAQLGGDTNGFFRIKDGDGVTQFEIIKGNKQELGADADGISVDNSTSPPTVTIPYSVVAGEHPVIQVCDDLTDAQWKAETAADCIANVSWAGESGGYVATVQRKTAGDRLFVKATYMSGGETYIRNVAPVGMDSIMLNGTKFYLGTNVISGKLVLTLSTTPVNQ